ncbi:MAG: RNA methyltransferase [Chloroflexi bacterium]|nr:RNA methyltransferase [Chloroflexota bacterium]MQC27185.1 RNA methyltransferase [Chloroflexota bacterium]
MEKITSHSNQKLKLARALRSRKGRDEEGLFLLEGVFHMGEALAAGAGFEFALVSPELLSSGFALKLASDLEAEGVPVYEVGADLLESVSGRENPNGLMGVLRQAYVGLEDLRADTFGRGVAVVEAADPGNLGSLLRTIDAAGADGLVLVDGGVDAYHPSALRAGMGAHFWRPMARASFADFAAWATGGGYRVIGSSATGEEPYPTSAARWIPENATHFPGGFEEVPWVLLLGSEREGLSEAQRGICERVVRIPMRGRVTSLNLAVAAGVLLYGLMGEK